MGGIEEKITRVLFCGQQFVDSYRYTKEYLSEHPYIQVKIIFGDFSALVKTKSICLFHYCAQFLISGKNLAMPMFDLVQVWLGRQPVLDIGDTMVSLLKYIRLPIESHCSRNFMFGVLETELGVSEG